jgi:hypothetical protein
MAQITDRTTFVEFWEDEIAGKMVDIESFVEYEDSEAIDKVKSPGVDTPVLVLFKPEFNSIDQRSDNVQRRINWGFWLVKRATEVENRAEIKQLKNDCHQIVEEIIGRLGYLNEEKEFWGKYHADDTNYEEIGPVLENHYGVACFGNFISGKGIIHNPAKWT